MSVLRNLESKLAGVVEGTFTRAFKSEVRPIELARKLVREMDEHKVRSLARTYAPNEFIIWLSPNDREHFLACEQELQQELGGYLLEYARAERLDLLGKPVVELKTDEDLRLGEFGIEARHVRPPQGEPKGSPSRPPQPKAEAGSDPSDAQPAVVQTTVQAQLRFNGRTSVIPNPCVVGRSRACDLVIDDPNVSRRHAQLQQSKKQWFVSDLGSTNGVKVNGESIDGQQPLKSGDVIELGSLSVDFLSR